MSIQHTNVGKAIENLKGAHANLLDLAFDGSVPPEAGIADAIDHVAAALRRLGDDSDGDD